MKIKYEIAMCSGCDVPKLITQKSLKLCQSCDGRRKTKLYADRRREREKKGVKADKKKLTPFYREVWDKLPHACFETGETLPYFSSSLVHHVLHKEDYPELALNHDICVLLSFQQHSLWHGLAPSDRAVKMPKTWQRLEELKIKYKL